MIMLKYILIIMMMMMMMFSAKAFTKIPLRKFVPNRSVSMVLTPFDRARSSLSPLTNMWDMFEELDRMPLSLPSAKMGTMNIDVKESNNKYELVVDIPGVPKDDIQITTKKDQIVISADRKAEKKEEGENFRRLERYSGHMSRTMTLPDNADVDHIDAKVENGVLTVTIPKTEKEETEAKKIDIK